MIPSPPSQGPAIAPPITASKLPSMFLHRRRSRIKNRHIESQRGGRSGLRTALELPSRFKSPELSPERLALHRARLQLICSQEITVFPCHQVAAVGLIV